MTDVFTDLGLVGTSAAIEGVRDDVRRYAPRSAPVLILGETGTGKELVARALHALSPRARAPFVAVNVATLRRDLTTSELFGHERGAFTGAVARRAGVFEQAHGGTLLLDELGELDLAAQADLLRVLETGEVRAVGAERARAVNVRVLAATHLDLAAAVGEGTFRADLYYRLHVLPVAVPPLRDRGEDLPAIVEHLLARMRPEVGVRTITNAALGALHGYAWPGNVRQVLNVLRRVCARTDAGILDTREVLAALALEPGVTEPQRYALPSRSELTPLRVAEALAASGGNVSQAARRLGVARSTVREKLRTVPKGHSGL